MFLRFHKAAIVLVAVLLVVYPRMAGYQALQAARGAFCRLHANKPDCYNLWDISALDSRSGW